MERERSVTANLLKGLKSAMRCIGSLLASLTDSIGPLTGLGVGEGSSLRNDPGDLDKFHEESGRASWSDIA